MKILAFTDIHSDPDAVNRICKKAKKEKADILVCCGDISFFGQGFESTLKKLGIGIPLFLVAGNHETFKQVKEAEKKFKFLKDIHLKPEAKDSILFFGCGGSSITPFNTPNEMPDSEFKHILSKFKGDNKRLFFVSHESPYKTKLDFIGRHSGSKAIRAFIEKYQPIYALCGHFHENDGKEDCIGKTKIINPGREGRIIELD